MRGDLVPTAVIVPVAVPGTLPEIRRIGIGKSHRA